jgi:hypothetical protein
LETDHVGLKLAERGDDVEWLPVDPEAAMQVQAGDSEFVDLTSLSRGLAPALGCRRVDAGEPGNLGAVSRWRPPAFWGVMLDLLPQEGQ